MHTLTTNSFDIQLDLTQDLLQDLSSTLDASSSGEESSDEEGEKQQEIDKDDQAEQAKLQEYTSRFQVGVWQDSEFMSRTDQRLVLKKKIFKTHILIHYL